MSNLLSNIPKHRRKLVEVIEDGSAKTFVYKDLDEKQSKDGFWGRFFGKQSQKFQEEVKS